MRRNIVHYVAMLERVKSHRAIKPYCAIWTICWHMRPHGTLWIQMSKHHRVQCSFICRELVPVAPYISIYLQIISWNTMIFHMLACAWYCTICLHMLTYEFIMYDMLIYVELSSYTNIPCGWYEQATVVYSLYQFFLSLKTIWDIYCINVALKGNLANAYTGMSKIIDLLQVNEYTHVMVVKDF